jgi:hypothetical protein
MEGSHHVALYWNGDCYYEGYVTLGRAEKKVLELAATDLYQRKLKTTDAVAVAPPQKAAPVSDEKVDSSFVKSGSPADTQYAPVTLSSEDANLEIWIDRERVARGQWSGLLPLGYHLIMTQKDGQESMPMHLWVENTFPVEMNLAVPQTSFGMLNIHSNVDGADIFLDGKHVGQTPYVVQQLDASRSYMISLRKDGYKESKKTVRPRGNALVEVEMKLKKK